MPIGTIMDGETITITTIETIVIPTTIVSTIMAMGTEIKIIATCSHKPITVLIMGIGTLTKV